MQGAGGGSRRWVRRMGAFAVFVPVVALVTAVSVAQPAGAALLTVTTAADVVADDGLCSLREAIEAADTDSPSGSTSGECPAGTGADLITFGVAGPFAGGHTIDSEVTIDGGPAGAVIAGATGSTGGSVFEVTPSGVVTLDSLTLSGGSNFSSGGGGLYNTGNTLVVDSTITANTASGGGGIMNGGGSLTVSNSTLSGNTTLAGGGGIWNLSGTVTVEFSTITANTGGISDNVIGTSTSVLAAIVQDLSGSVSVDAYSIVGGDPELGPLADNGGPTWTHLPAHDSPAVDRAIGAVGSDPVLDQRGVARPQGAAKDAGAVEREDLWVRPFGAVLWEGNSGTTTADVVVFLEDGNGDPATSITDVTVDFNTVDAYPNPLIAQAGSDFVSTAGTLTIPAGASQATVPVEIIGDTIYEPNLLYGEWALIQFTNLSANARLNLGFFGLGLIIIGNDDPPP